MRVRIAERIGQSPFLRVYTVAFGGQSSAPAVTLTPVAHSGLLSALRESDDQELKRSLLRAYGGDDLATNQVTQLPMLDEHDVAQAYFVPTVSGSSKPEQGLLIVPVTPSSPLGARVAGRLSIALFLTAGMFSVYSVTRTLRSNEHGRWIDLLRNLPQGFLETREDEQVVIANDRAEEVLNMTLPKTRHDPLGPNFRDDLIEPVVIRPAADDKLTCVDFSEIRRLRAQDQHSWYYACLRTKPKGKRAWIKVSAGPILLPRVAGRGFLPRRKIAGAPRTFGTIERVDKRIAAELNSLRDEHDHRLA